MALILWDSSEGIIVARVLWLINYIVWHIQYLDEANYKD